MKYILTILISLINLMAISQNKHEELKNKYSPIKYMYANQEHTLWAEEEYARDIAVVIAKLKHNDVDIKNLTKVFAIMTIHDNVEGFYLDNIGAYIVIKEQQIKKRYVLIATHEILHNILNSNTHCNDELCPELLKNGSLINEKYTMENWDLNLMSVINYIKEKQKNKL